MKRLTVPCGFGGVTSPFHVYIGKPAPGVHPLKYQNAWLKELRGGHMPEQVLDTLQKLADIALTHGLSFEDLCIYALGVAGENQKAEEGERAEV